MNSYSMEKTKFNENYSKKQYLSDSHYWENKYNYGVYNIYNY